MLGPILRKEDGSEEALCRAALRGGWGPRLLCPKVQALSLWSGAVPLSPGAPGRHSHPGPSDVKLEDTVPSCARQEQRRTAPRKAGSSGLLWSPSGPQKKTELARGTRAGSQLSSHTADAAGVMPHTEQTSVPNRESRNKYSRHLSVLTGNPRLNISLPDGLQCHRLGWGPRSLMLGSCCTQLQVGSVLSEPPPPAPGPQKLKMSSCSGPLLLGLSQSTGERHWASWMSCAVSPVSKT